MSRQARRVVIAGVLAIAGLTVAAAPPAQQGSPVTYRVSFPAAEHHSMRVEVVFPDVGGDPLHVRMSRSSPGRYAAHDFAKNVSQVEVFDGAGRRLTPARRDPDEWIVAGHDGTVRVVYHVFGDHADGTYLGIDTTHAHLNMPAAFLWADGLDLRPIRITFDPPAGSSWSAATQLLPAESPWTFTAPNLQYFMDSPVELAALEIAAIDLPAGAAPPAKFRIAAHVDAPAGDLQALAASTATLLREQVAVFGEFPAFEGGTYTFLLDGMPWTFDDAMEHRNSTMVTVPGLSLGTASGRLRALSSMSHEFFHVWNVERIRPVGLEPFDFTRANVTCCLWLAEGFTQYYGVLLLHRAGLGNGLPVGVVDPVVNGSGRRVRSVIEMSEYAPFADAAVSNDMTDQARSFISYYTFGAAIALGLDLSLREWSRGTISLDDYMRRLWERYGKPADVRPGYVARPYTLEDLRRELAELTTPPFADEFFDRFVAGRDVPDFQRLLALAGFVLRPAASGRGWIGDVPVSESAGGLLVGVAGFGNRALTAVGSPLYDAGIDGGDVVTAIDGQPATRAAWEAIGRRRPGDVVTLAIRRRDGRREDRRVEVGAQPRLEVVALESTGATLTAAQSAFRQAWLGSRVR
ncbi:MAG: M61 family metallopeptidase [Acidobacteria bacterium]|nr:M61 family metallopeptidase [Acidobacteriota bacterium]